MNKLDLALNNLQWFICHKNKPNQAEFQLHNLEQIAGCTGLYVDANKTVYMCF